MSANDIIDRYESGDFDHDGKTSMDFITFYLVRMYQGQRTSVCGQITSLTKDIRTHNSRSLDWKIIIQMNSYPEAAKIDELLKSKTAEDQATEDSQATGTARGTPVEFL